MISQLDCQISFRLVPSEPACVELAVREASLSPNRSPPIHKTPAMSVPTIRIMNTTRTNREVPRNVSQLFCLSSRESRRAEYQFNETKSKKIDWQVRPRIPPREFDKTSAVQGNTAIVR